MIRVYSLDYPTATLPEPVEYPALDSLKAYVDHREGISDGYTLIREDSPLYYLVRKARGLAPDPTIPGHDACDVLGWQAGHPDEAYCELVVAYPDAD